MPESDPIEFPMTQIIRRPVARFDAEARNIPPTR
jgi:hypothetical protein